MKFHEPRSRAQSRPKSTEVLAHPEVDRALIFDIYDFFTVEEWDGLVETLTKFDYDEDEVVEFEARNFLDGSLALKFLDQEKLDQLRGNIFSKRTIRGYLRDTDPEARPEDWQTFNAIAVWLWPELEQVEEIKDQVTKFRKSAEKKTKRKEINYLHAGEMALLYPDLKDQLGLGEQWLVERRSVDDDSILKIIKSELRLGLVEHLFFPLEMSDEDPLTVKEWVKQGLNDQRKSNLFIENLGDNLLTVAFVRLVIKQDVIYSNAGIQITDRKLLHNGPELPQRPQI